MKSNSHARLLVLLCTVTIAGTVLLLLRYDSQSSASIDMSAFNRVTVTESTVIHAVNETADGDAVNALQTTDAMTFDNAVDVATSTAAKAYEARPDWPTTSQAPSLPTAIDYASDEEEQFDYGDQLPDEMTAKLFEQSVAAAEAADSELYCRRHLQCKHLALASAPEMPRCNVLDGSEAYLRGSWREALPTQLGRLTNTSLVQVQHDWLADHAYSYQDECNQAAVDGTFRCHTAEPNACRVKSMDVVKYQWMPDSCYLEDFDSTTLDFVMANKTVVFVGDSLMRQQFNSWRFLLRQTISPQAKDIVNESHEQFSTVNGATYVFEWAKFLVADRDSDMLVNGGIKLNLDIGWARRLRESRVDVLMMNVGHHWHKADVDFKLYDSMVDQVVAYVKTHFRGSHVLFRTSAVGHYDCGTDPALRRPSHKVPLMTAANDKYNWRKPIQAERIWMDRMRQGGLAEQFRFLNVSISQFRPDGHPEWNIRGRLNIDCLHWCLPGIPDTWNHLLFNLLLETYTS